MATQAKNLVEETYRFETDLSEARREPRALGVALKDAEAKIREELFRFRTCCADPRASK